VTDDNGDPCRSHSAPKHEPLSGSTEHANCNLDLALSALWNCFVKRERGE
jgi:hypothetical protein